MKKMLIILAALLLVLTTSVSAAGINGTPIIILKCDDYKSNNAASIENFEKLFQILQEENVTASFGIVGNSSTSGNTAAFWENTKKYIASGIEIWSHGWLHRKNDEGVAEFNGMLSYDEMKTNFQKVIDLVAKNTDGYQITSFGAPYNAISSECLSMIQQDFPQIKAIFFTGKEPATEAVRLTNSMKIETGTGKASYDAFLESYNPDLDYAAIQSHPGNFSDESREEYRNMIQFLKSKNSVFMTPTQYANYTKELAAYRSTPEEKIAVLCYNKIVQFDTAPFIEDGRTLVPMRALAESLGCFVAWSEKEQKVTVIGNTDDVVLHIGSNIAYVGDKEVTLDVPAKIADGRTMIPLRFVAEAFGAEVQWDSAMNMAVIK